MTTKAGIASVVRVADIMSTPVTALRVEATLDQAQKALTENKVSGAPVVDGERLVGVVTKSDLVDPRNDYQARVDKVMTHVVYAVRAEDPAILAVQLMVQEEIHRVIVVDGGGSIKGIVTSSDVLRALTEGKHITLLKDLELSYVDVRNLD